MTTEPFRYRWAARGDIKAEVVINCAGQWAKQLGRMAGVTVPLQAADCVRQTILGPGRDARH